MSEIKDMNLPNNSHRAREERSRTDATNREIKPVANASIRKKSPGKKFVQSVFADDMHSVKDFVLQDVLLPTIKETLSQVVTNGIDILLYGEARGRREPSRRGGATYYRSSNERVSYRSSYDANRPRSARDDRRPMTKSDFFIDEIEFDTYEAAYRVLADMRADLDIYPCVTVGNLFDYAGLTDKSVWTNDNHGWTNLDNARILERKVWEGGRYEYKYILDLPRPLPID